MCHTCKECAITTMAFISNHWTSVKESHQLYYQKHRNTKNTVSSACLQPDKPLSGWNNQIFFFLQFFTKKACIKNEQHWSAEPSSQARWEVFMLIICVRFCSCLCKLCSRVSEALLPSLQTCLQLNNSSSDSKAFLRFIAFSGSPTAVNRCMHYGITLWAYLSEPLV